jgi:hypothetical protein
MKLRHGKNSNRFVSVRGYAAFLILLSAPFLMGAGENDRTEIEENRRQIRNLTSEQQAKLKRNFAEFQKLSVEDQNVIRKLHRRLKEDAHNGGNLRELMLVYKEWLKTLSPWDREKLLKQKDPAARLELVREIKNWQAYEEWKETLTITERGKLRGVTGEAREKLIREFKRDPETLSRRSSSGYRPRWFRPPISSEEFDNVMALVEENTVIDQNVRAQFSEIKKVELHLLVLLAAVKQSQKQQNTQIGDQPNFPFSPKMPVRWPDDELMKKLMVILEDSDIQKRLQSSESQEGRRRSLFFSIMGSLHSEWWGALKQNSPSDEELQEFFKQLDQSKKDDLLRRSGSEQSRKLKFLYYLAQPKFHNEYSEFRNISRRYYHRPGPRRGRPPGGRGHGERGRDHDGPRGEFGPEKRPPFSPRDKEFRKGPPRR